MLGILYHPTPPELCGLWLLMSRPLAIVYQEWNTKYIKVILQHYVLWISIIWETWLKFWQNISDFKAEVTIYEAHFSYISLFSEALARNTRINVCGLDNFKVYWNIYCVNLTLVWSFEICDVTCMIIFNYFSSVEGSLKLNLNLVTGNINIYNQYNKYDSNVSNPRFI
jgi:hypothetical protein